MSTVPATLQAIWLDSRTDVFAQVEAVTDALTDALTGSLAETVRAAATREAHKLSGSVGTLGFTVATQHARGTSALSDE